MANLCCFTSFYQLKAQSMMESLNEEDWLRKKISKQEKEMQLGKENENESENCSFKCLIKNCILNSVHEFSYLFLFVRLLFQINFKFNYFFRNSLMYFSNNVACLCLVLNFHL